MKTNNTTGTKLLVLLMLSCDLSLYHCNLSANQQVQPQTNAKKTEANSELGSDKSKVNQTRPKGEDATDAVEDQNFQAQQLEEQAAQDEEKFDLWELRIKGNHLLKDTEIERTIYPYVGPQKTIKTVENARAALKNSTITSLL